MILKKVCMLGGFAVGKTSVVRRFVDSIFSDAYLTTVGVKIDKKLMTAKGQPISLMLWDMAGEDAFHTVQMSYMRGAHGYLLVVDGTRAATVQTALSLKTRVEDAVGILPYVVLVNKADLRHQWELTDADLDSLRMDAVLVAETSAKTGDGVEDVFSLLAERLLEG